MVKIADLKQEVTEKRKKALDILEIANNENRELTETEVSTRSTLETEITGLKNRIDQMEAAKREKLEVAESNKSASEKIPGLRKGGEAGEMKKIVKKYSFLRAVASQMPNGKVDGLEAEMHQEAVNEARESGLSLAGLGVPGAFMKTEKQVRESRDMEVGTTTAGGHLVQTSVAEMIPFLRPRLMTESLGATVLPGLKGDLTIPRNNAVGSGTWEGEDDANAETTGTLDTISLSPNRLGAYTEITKQLIFQAENEAVENFVRNDLNMAIRVALDLAAINGSGSGNQPTGLLSTSGIGDVAGGTNGANPDWADIVDLENDVATANADIGNLAYLTTPGVRGYLKKTLLDSGSGLFIWPNDQRPNGYRAEVSTQVPSTLTKGTSSGVCHAIIFGNWSDLIIANWAGIDLVVDPYSLSKNAKIQLVINSWWDIAVRHAASFSAMQDALI